LDYNNDWYILRRCSNFSRGLFCLMLLDAVNRSDGTSIKSELFKITDNPNR
jgi:hypothetical protein